MVGRVFTIAGMPSVLPQDIEAIFRWNGTFLERVQSISFFVVVIVVATRVLQVLWNIAANDSRVMPRITFARACCLVILWGALFVIVLTMISGAREILTPGAWKKSGRTYELSKEPEIVPAVDGD